MNKDNYFFSYSFLLTKYLVDRKGFKFICEAKHRINGNTFWLFERSTSLNKALTEYSKASETFLNEMRQQYKYKGE